MNRCPCSSGALYEDCCKGLHDGAFPKNALELMRSRYAAYALNKPEYIIKTTHPASPQYSENKFSWKRHISRFAQNTQFKRLDIHEFKENGTLATVVFTAHILQKGSEATFSEKSFFEKTGDLWLYKGGRTYAGEGHHLVTPGPLKLLPLAYYGEPVLRRKGDPILEITDEIKELVEGMIETMDTCDGIGLAAPQVHQSLRLFITRVPTDEQEDQNIPGEVIVFINPVLSDPSHETEMLGEGCLSIPGVHEEIRRPSEITVTYTNLEGKAITARFSGYQARAVMHENDHINGVLFIDRMDDKDRKLIDPIIKNLKKRITKS